MHVRNLFQHLGFHAAERCRQALEKEQADHRVRASKRKPDAPNDIDETLHQNFHITPFLKLVLKSPVPVIADNSPYTDRLPSAVTSREP